MAHRQERFSSFLKKEIADFLQKNFARENGIFISVAMVAARERSDKAEVYVHIFPESHAKELFPRIKKLEKSARQYISSRSRRHFIPQIRFVLSGGDEESRLEKLLEKVKNE